MLHILSINNSTKYLTEVLLDPSFAGALCGALITGGIALFLYTHENRRAKSLQKQQYAKVFIKIEKHLQLTKDAAIQYKKIIIGERKYEENELLIFNKLFESVSLELDEIDTKDIPYSIHVNFNELTDALTTIKLLSGIFMEVGSVGDYKKELIEDIERYLKNLNQYIEYFNKRKR